MSTSEFFGHSQCSNYYSHDIIKSKIDDQNSNGYIGKQYSAVFPTNIYSSENINSLNGQLESSTSYQPSISGTSTSTVYSKSKSICPSSQYNSNISNNNINSNNNNSRSSSNIPQNTFNQYNSISYTGQPYYEFASTPAGTFAIPPMINNKPNAIYNKQQITYMQQNSYIAIGSNYSMVVPGYIAPPNLPNKQRPQLYNIYTPIQNYQSQVETPGNERTIIKKSNISSQVSDAQNSDGTELSDEEAENDDISENSIQNNEEFIEVDRSYNPISNMETQLLEKKAVNIKKSQRYKLCSTLLREEEKRKNKINDISDKKGNEEEKENKSKKYEPWSAEETELLRFSIISQRLIEKDCRIAWQSVSSIVQRRTKDQCRDRYENREKDSITKILDYIISLGNKRYTESELKKLIASIDLSTTKKDKKKMMNIQQVKQVNSYPCENDKPKLVPLSEEKDKINVFNDPKINNCQKQSNVISQPSFFGHSIELSDPILDSSSEKSCTIYPAPRQNQIIQNKINQIQALSQQKQQSYQVQQPSVICQCTSNGFVYPTDPRTYGHKPDILVQVPGQIQNYKAIKYNTSNTDSIEKADINQTLINSSTKNTNDNTLHIESREQTINNSCINENCIKNNTGSRNSVNQVNEENKINTSSITSTSQNKLFDKYYNNSGNNSSINLQSTQDIFHKERLISDSKFSPKTQCNTERINCQQINNSIENITINDRNCDLKVMQNLNDGQIYPLIYDYENLNENEDNSEKLLNKNIDLMTPQTLEHNTELDATSHIEVQSKTWTSDEVFLIQSLFPVLGTKWKLYEKYLSRNKNIIKSKFHNLLRSDTKIAKTFKSSIGYEGELKEPESISPSIEERYKQADIIIANNINNPDAAPAALNAINRIKNRQGQINIKNERYKLKSMPITEISTRVKKNIQEKIKKNPIDKIEKVNVQ